MGYTLAKGRGVFSGGGILGIREIPPRRASDEHFASIIGRLYVDDRISLVEYEAGARYANVVLSYLRTTDAPDPFGNGDLEGVPDEICFQRKLNFAAARQVLSELDRRCGLVLDRVAVYDEPLRDGDLPPLRNALRALAGQ